MCGDDGVGVEEFGDLLVVEGEGLVVVSLEGLDFDGSLEG